MHYLWNSIEEYQWVCMKLLRNIITRLFYEITKKNDGEETRSYIY